MIDESTINNKMLLKNEKNKKPRTILVGNKMIEI